MKTFKEPMRAIALLDENVEHTDEAILAALNKLRYPVLATVKLDGVRALRLNGTLLSRNLKQIPNVSICHRGSYLPAGFDMELCADGMTFNEIQSIVMSRKHELEDKITFNVLDWIMPEEQYSNFTYSDRIFNAIKIIESRHQSQCYLEHPTWIYTVEQLFQYFKKNEQLGAEGICFRTPDSPYKQGKSTLNEQYLIKLCRWLRMEVTVIGYEEQIAVGKRATPLNTLGSLLVTDDKSRTFSVGSGFTAAERLRIWNNKQAYMGKTLTIKYKPCSEKINPRHPTFVGWREKGY